MLYIIDLYDVVLNIRGIRKGPDFQTPSLFL